MPKIDLVGFAPDLPIDTPGVVTDCTNFIPTIKGFKGAPSLAPGGYPVLASKCIGAATVQKLDGTFRAFAGTTTKLYEASGGAWTNQTRASGGDYTANTQLNWRFTQFGDTTLAAVKSDTLQFSNGSGAFADVAGAPKASLVEAVGNFVFLADTNDLTYGDNTDRWWCSGLYDYSEWTPSPVTQCTTGRLVDAPGKIVAMRALGSSVVIYKERAIYIGSYVGSPTVWKFSRVPGEVGTWCQETVVSVEGYHIFIGPDNFYRMDGSRPTAINTAV